MAIERTPWRVATRLAAVAVIAAAVAMSATQLTSAIATRTSTGATATSSWQSRSPGAAALIHWSTRAAAYLVPGSPPASSQVQLAKVHIAMHDAVVAIRGGYRPFLADVNVPRGAMVRAAVAAAARGVLAGLLPEQQGPLRDELDAYLATLPPGTSRDRGVGVGAAVAAQVLVDRADDGMTDTVPYVQPERGPGVFEPTPPPPTPVDIKLTRVRPFVLISNDQFRPGGPPARSSDQYARALDEVARLGEKTGSERSVKQTETAMFFADQTAGQWNRALTGIAADQRLGTLRTARMLLVTNLAAADGVLGCWDAKFHFMAWRPVHAIQRADTDGNPATIAQPDWQPLLIVNHPEYPSGHACFTAGATRALQAFFHTGNLRVVMSSVVTNTTRVYPDLSAVRSDVRVARIVSGLHFRHSMNDGDILGTQVARWIAARH
ncbi:MAG: vanadium-dependent haloperoxidase [Actinomycetes bacterium]